MSEDMSNSINYRRFSCLNDVPKTLRRQLQTLGDTDPTGHLLRLATSHDALIDRLWLAVDPAGRCLGWCAAYEAQPLIEEDRLPGSPPSSPSPMISVWVREEQRGKGVGKELLMKAAQEIDAPSRRIAFQGKALWERCLHEAPVTGDTLPSTQPKMKGLYS
jgi:GNAT superfamily N-acetyltransferase